MDSTKRTVTIDASDLEGGFRIVSKALQDIHRTPVDIRNLDAFFDVITEYGSGLRLVVRNADRLPPEARAMLDDALASATGLEIDFGRPNGGSGRRAHNAGLVRLMLWMVAVGGVIAVVWQICRNPGTGL